jgi:ferrochelatase
MVSFGGPEGPDDVMPFLENVLRGKNVPRERMLEVAEHYNHFGGVSPINQQCRDFLDALKTALAKRGIELPVYWGNRNWHPMLNDTFETMKHDGRKRAIAFFTSMFSCYSGCRQYRENIAASMLHIGQDAPLVEKTRMGFNHPKFIEAQADCLLKARSLLKNCSQISEDLLASTPVLFSAHSIPQSMADHSRYVLQLNEAARLICEKIGHQVWEVVFQSRSGPPHQPWLEPDVCDRIEQLHAEKQIQSVIVQPLGFVSDHMEVLYDLDHEASDKAKELGIQFVRAPSVGTHPQFVEMTVDLIEERLTAGTARPCLGSLGPSHDICPVDCCLYPQPTRPAGAGRPT